MSNKKKVKEILKAYKACEKAFGMGGGIMEAGKDIALEDEEKYEFFRIVYTYFLQKKQEELINQGVF